MDHGPDPSDDAAHEGGDERVGYKNPPKHTRWPKGHCPNPRGRPPKAQGRKAILERVANEKCEVKVGGQVQTRTKVEVVLLAVRNATANGNPAAQSLFNKLLAETREEGPPIPKGVLITREKLTHEEWLVEYGYLGRLGPPPPPKLIQLIDCRHLLPRTLR